MNEEIEKMVKYLRLRSLVENWDRYLDTAKENNFSYERLLECVVRQEYKIKKENARQLRIKKAKLPEKLRIESFPFDKQPKLNKQRLITIYEEFDYIRKCQNIIFIGPTGTGKTGLATAFMLQAIDKGFKGRFISFPDLIEILFQSIADHSEAKVIKTFADYDCLILDEIGYVEVEPAQVGLFFSLMQKRHKKKTTLITSNLGFSQWASFLKNNHLTAALIDRLTENSYLINMNKCVSLRSKLPQNNS